jgi:hypothetical protein
MRSTPVESDFPQISAFCRGNRNILEVLDPAAQPKWLAHDSGRCPAQGLPAAAEALGDPLHRRD